MVKQFSARGVKVAASGSFRSNYTLEYITKLQGIKDLEVSSTISWGARMVQRGERQIGLVMAWCRTVCEGWRS